MCFAKPPKKKCGSFLGEAIDSRDSQRLTCNVSREVCFVSRQSMQWRQFFHTIHCTKITCCLPCFLFFLIDSTFQSLGVQVTEKRWFQMEQAHAHGERAKMWEAS